MYIGCVFYRGQWSTLPISHDIDICLLKDYFHRCRRKSAMGRMSASLKIDCNYCLLTHFFILYLTISNTLTMSFSNQMAKCLSECYNLPYQTCILQFLFKPKRLIDPVFSKLFKLVYAPIEDSGQPAHPRGCAG